MTKLINKDIYAETIKKVIAKELTQKEAAIKLEITDRQIRRLIVKYKSIGDKAFLHQNANKPSHNNKKISVELATKIIDDYLNDYSSYGFTHFYEEHGFKYGISFSAMNTIFLNNDIISPFAQHKTVKKCN